MKKMLNHIIAGLSVKIDIRLTILFDYVKYKIIIKNKDNVDLNGFTQNGKFVNVGLVVVYGGSIDSSDVGINFKEYYSIYK
ncbi:unknown [Firmicutes bacterium CAG:582]|nr:unknown [Firmicutes bacterium CAG:582]